MCTRIWAQMRSMLTTQSQFQWNSLQIAAYKLISSFNLCTLRSAEWVALIRIRKLNMDMLHTTYTWTRITEWITIQKVKIAIFQFFHAKISSYLIDRITINMFVYVIDMKSICAPHICTSTCAWCTAPLVQYDLSALS